MNTTQVIETQASQTRAGQKQGVGKGAERAEIARRVTTRRGQRGMTTAEYAVGTIAAVSFAGILIRVLSDPGLQQLIMQLIVFLIKLFWPGAGQ